MSTDRQTVRRIEALEAEVFGTNEDEGEDTPPTAAELERETRDDLEDLAREVGVDGDPSDREQYGNKRDLAAAIVRERDA